MASELDSPGTSAGKVNKLRHELNGLMNISRATQQKPFSVKIVDLNLSKFIS